MAEHKTGTSQLETDDGADFTSVKTSPGTAKTFSSRAANDIRGACGASDCVSGNGGVGSIFEKSTHCSCVNPARILAESVRFV